MMRTFSAIKIWDKLKQATHSVCLATHREIHIDYWEDLAFADKFDIGIIKEVSPVEMIPRMGDEGFKIRLTQAT